MKKKTVCFVFAMSALLLTTACGNTNESSQEKVLLNYQEVNHEKVAFQGIAIAETEYDADEYIQAETDSVIYGTVQDVNYQVLDDGNIITIQTISVESTIAGNPISDSTITVWKSGGIATLDMFIQSFLEVDRESIRNKFASYTDEELDDNYIEAYTVLDIPSEVGMSFVLFLKDTSLSTADYKIVYDNYGEYYELDNGMFFTSKKGVSLDEYYSIISSETEYEGEIDLTGIVTDRSTLFSDIQNAFE